MLKGFDLYTQIALIIVIVGGICWLLVGLFNFFILTAILGGFARILYIIVGLAALWLCYKIYKSTM